jgi:hypothetical protein
VATVTALVLDLANILGGLVLAATLLGELPGAGRAVSAVTGPLARVGVVLGVVALAAGTYYLIAHIVSGPHVFHFELVGIGVGVALLRERLFPRTAAPAGGPTPSDFVDTRPQPSTAPIPAPAPVAGMSLLLAVYGLVAIVVGIQGLLTPDG